MIELGIVNKKICHGLAIDWKVAIKRKGFKSKDYRVSKQNKNAVARFYDSGISKETEYYINPKREGKK